MQVTVRLPDKLVCYVVFSGFCIMGTYFGFQIEGAIANTRAIGAVLGGLLGGPVVGFLVGLTGGLHRYSLGGFTDSACAVSTTVEGLVGGCVHAYLLRRNQADAHPAAVDRAGDHPGRRGAADDHHPADGEAVRPGRATGRAHRRCR